jgi:DNA-binding GntR family transcriptional regulator
LGNGTVLDASGLIQSDGETQQGDVAFEMLRADIVACRIAPGANISEAELADRYRLGKAGVRRALVRLAERGWVRALARRGYLVKPVALRDIGEIFEFRRAVEPVAVRHPAGRADINRLRQLDAICGAGFMSGDAASQATFLQAHRQLHLAIVTAGGNVRLTSAFEPLWDETERVIHHAGLMRSRAADLRHDHGTLIAALAAGRGDDAAAAVDGELERLHRLLVETALKTPSLLAPAPKPAEPEETEAEPEDKTTAIRGLGKTGRQGRAIEP